MGRLASVACWALTVGCASAPVRPPLPSEARPAGPAAPRTATGPGLAPLRVWSETRISPRPLRVHVARVDLRAGVWIDTLVAPDPDGDGPAEAQLLSPHELMARSPDSLLAVNANAFRSLPHWRGMRTNQWRHGLPVDVIGLAVMSGRRISRPWSQLPALWFDRRGGAHIGRLPRDQPVAAGVSGWIARLLKRGNPVPRAGGALHPRTLMGLDRQRRRLLLAVVDGRRPGYSEGMTLAESARLMRRLGAYEAINVDGGGSSAMLQRKADGQIVWVNRPSGAGPRPVPVMLAVRSRP